MIKTDIKVGQVLWLKIRYQIDKIATVKHPMLVAKITENYIEVIAIDKTAGKLHQLFKECNHYINCDNPKEKVIFEDSYAQLNTKITLECYNCLLKCRKTNEILSFEKLHELLEKYDSYQKENKVFEERIVHMSINEILLLNEELVEKVAV